MNSGGAAFPLCVASRLIGQRSETFVRRHAQDILPGRTAMVGERMAEPAYWEPQGPCHLIYGGLSKSSRVAWRLLNKTVRRGKDVLALQEFLRRHGVEAMIVEFMDVLLPYLDAVQETGVRWYSFGHGFDVSCRLADPVWARRFEAHRRAAGVFVRAEIIRARLIEKLSLDPAKVHVVRGGIDVPNSFHRRSKKLEVRVVAVGRMMAKKGPVETVRSFKHALKEAPMLHLDYIGEGPLFEDVERYVWSNRLEEKVTLHGGQSPEFVAAKLREGDLFVQHSLRDPQTGDEEGLPASITEAMAMGLPVVSTLHAGIPEAVLQGEQGFLVAEGDTQAMGSRIAELALDYDQRIHLGEAGWNRARELFTWEGERRRILELTGLENA
jgi:colanic acid/amylovoran biosynthesis glycosyltransferase